MLGKAKELVAQEGDHTPEFGDYNDGDDDGDDDDDDDDIKDNYFDNDDDDHLILC